MLTVLLVVLVVVLGVALGAVVYRFFDFLMKTAERMVEQDRLFFKDDGSFLLALFLYLSMAIVLLLVAFPLAWGALSHFLIDNLVLGTASVYVGMALSRLLLRVGRELNN